MKCIVVPALGHPVEGYTHILQNGNLAKWLHSGSRTRLFGENVSVNNMLVDVMTMHGMAAHSILW